MLYKIVMFKLEKSIPDIGQKVVRVSMLYWFTDWVAMLNTGCRVSRSFQSGIVCTPLTCRGMV